ncbi:MAG: exodeoxyribonuclease V subunit gamma, partial [Candidatus Marinimicrobia bacterium]|nr:exodeoxyribonuclease V subunit gamma [Candidatus Neomarinimicrobiota bacterium]
ERGWFNAEAQREALSTVITSDFPDVSVQDVLTDCQVLLEKTRQHHLYTILSNPDIEQYHELSLSGWLRHDKDILHVNGVIDFLYCHKGQWVVVDFKTDTGTEQLDAYRRQIQSYLWMVKQVYDIDAVGKLYFAALDECIDIAWDEHYFDTVLDERGYRPMLPEAQVNVESLLPLLNAKKHVLFCASTYHAGQVFLDLVHNGLMRPSITITTLNKWIRRSQIRTLSDDRLRLMVQQESRSTNRGYSDFLAQALRDTELKKGTLLAEFFPLQQRVNALRKMAGYQSYAEVYQDPELWSFPTDTIIGFIDLPPLTPLEKNLRSIMEKNAESFSCLLIPKTEQTKTVQFIQAFSPREEVLAVADHIFSSILPKEDILIAVSSMAKYAPHIKRLFPPLGLHARFTDTRLLMEFPLTALLLDFLRICSLSHCEWTDIAPLLLHPLCKPSTDLHSYDSDV